MSRGGRGRRRSGPPSEKRNLATISLTLSVLVAVGGFGYFWWHGDLLAGVVVGAILLAAGLWEYRTKARHLQDEERAEGTAEGTTGATAEEHRERERS